MGYKPSKKTFQLELEDYPGMEVTVRSSSMGQLLEMESLKVSVNEPDPKKKLAVFDFMAGRIITWNVDHPDTDGPDTDEKKWNPLEDPCPRCGLVAGQPLPTTSDAMLCLEMDMVMNLFFGWIFAVARVSLPKGMGSNVGGMNLQEELMNELGRLQNPGTLQEQN